MADIADLGNERAEQMLSEALARHQRSAAATATSVARRRPPPARCSAWIAMRPFRHCAGRKFRAARPVWTASSCGSAGNE